MHVNAALLERLFTALDRHDHRAMSACYQTSASFDDIAFELTGIQKIHSMWHMICDGDIRATFQVIEADDVQGRVALVDTYTFGANKEPAKPGRPVRNVVDSHFVFRQGLIAEHHDHCDPRAWASAALGGPFGFLAWRIGWLRRWKAKAKLKDFVRRHPEYR